MHCISYQFNIENKAHFVLEAGLNQPCFFHLFSGERREKDKYYLVSKEPYNQKIILPDLLTRQIYTAVSMPFPMYQVLGSIGFRKGMMGEQGHACRFSQWKGQGQWHYALWLVGGAWWVRTFYRANRYAPPGLPVIPFQNPMLTKPRHMWDERHTICYTFQILGLLLFTLTFNELANLKAVVDIINLAELLIKQS